MSDKIAANAHIKSSNNKVDLFEDSKKSLNDIINSKVKVPNYSPP